MFLAVLQTWQSQGEQLIIMIDMNEHVLDGPLAKQLMGPGLKLKEATHTAWVGEEPHTFIGGSEPIDACYYSEELEVVCLSTKQLSFHQGVGDHMTVLVDFFSRSMIGQHEFKVVRPTAQKLSTQNKKSRIGYVSRLRDHIKYHKLQERLDKCTNAIVQSNGGVLPDIISELETIHKQTVELQINAEENCWRLTNQTNFPFSKPDQTWVNRRRVYQALLRRHEGKCGAALQCSKYGN